MTAPAIVSVIVPVWNAERYLRDCLDSVVEQTIGLDRLEIIAVDDGSTDSSGPILDEYAARHPQLTVIHQPNSGGPGRPRNVGLDHAAGTFVFFLDADDFLGPEAIERLVAMADRNGSDIVLARMVGMDGRRVPTGAFRRSIDRASVTDVYSTLSVLKLFRRSLIERLGLRFEEGLSGHEDGPFTARAYFESEVISVLADYDAYHVRPGSASGKDVDLVPYLGNVSTRMELVARYRAPGIGRDRLMARHISDIVRAFSIRWLALDAEARAEVFDAGVDLIRRWHTGRIQRTLAPWAALRTHCLRHELRSELEDIAAATRRSVYRDPIVDGSRVFLRYPHFRDDAGIPDECFEITSRLRPHAWIRSAKVEGGVLHLSGHAYLPFLGGSTSVLIRRWPRGADYLVPTTAMATAHLKDRYATYPKAGFEAAIDLSTVADGGSLSSGTWDILVSVGTDLVRRTVRLRPVKGARVPSARRQRESAARSAIYRAGAGRLRLRVGATAPYIYWLERVESRYRRLTGSP